MRRVGLTVGTKEGRLEFCVDLHRGHVKVGPYVREQRARSRRGSPRRRAALEPRSRSRAEHRHRSEEHTSELQSLLRISYDVLCFKNKSERRCYGQSTSQEYARITTTTHTSYTQL